MRPLLPRRPRYPHRHPRPPAADEGRSEPPVDVLANGGRRAGTDARAAERRAGICGRLPGFHDALADGAVSSGHLDALARATARFDDAERAAFDDHSDTLLDDAKAMTVDEFATACRDKAREVTDDDGVAAQDRLRRQRTVSRRIDPDTGMAITRVTLDPLADEAMWQAVNTVIRSKVATGTAGDESWEHIAVDTLVDLVTRPTAQTRPAHPAPSRGDADAGDAAPVTAEAESAPATADERQPDADHRADDHSAHDSDEPALSDADDEPAAAAPLRVPEVYVHIDWLALCRDAVDDGLCETAAGNPVPIATVRRLCCEASIIPVVIGGDGAVLDVGRATRLATPDQRRALSAMYVTCGYPGCHVQFAHCQVHHVTDWTLHRGPTDLANLLPLCSRHHHLVHEGRWTLELRADRTVTLTRPDGTVHYDGTSINRHRRRPPPRAA
ncbi:MAG: HNH endonuclease [Actinomycetota bacterium]|nr:HNH endonuclease [Actinomycetota bacterium]